MKKRISINLDTLPSSGDPSKDAMFRTFMAGVKAGIDVTQNKTAGRPEGSTKTLHANEVLRRYVLIERRIMRGMSKTAAAKDLANRDRRRAWRTNVRHYDDAVRRLQDRGLRNRVDWALYLEYRRNQKIPPPAPDSLSPEWREAFALDLTFLPTDPPRHVAK